MICDASESVTSASDDPNAPTRSFTSSQLSKVSATGSASVRILVNDCIEGVLTELVPQEGFQSFCLGQPREFHRGFAIVVWRLLLLGFCVVLQSQSVAEHRTALLIDNTNSVLPKTREASPEIKRLGVSLRQHGFRSTKHTNLTATQMERAVDQFIKSAPINGTTLIYFRGNVRVSSLPDSGKAAVLSCAGHDRDQLTISGLMDWLFLHSAAGQNVIVIDTPAYSTDEVRRLVGKAVPANVWIGFAKRLQQDADANPKSGSQFVSLMEDSKERQLGKLLDAACSWKVSKCRKSAFARAASVSVSPPDAFPGMAKAGDEWVTDKGSVYCFCPARNDMSGYWIGKYEVTQSKWTTPDFFGGVGEERNHPAIRQNPAKLCSRLKDLTILERKHGRLPLDWEYALPTSQEWTHAALAGASGDQYFDSSQLTEHANFADKSLFDLALNEFLYASPHLNDGTPKLAAVGSYLPNAWGLHDVFGNVWEQTDTGILRGGSWVSLPNYCRVSIQKPALKFPADYIGFRIVIRRMKKHENSNHVIRRENR